jgi:ribosomal peptide maturation radical SAM protein 1
MREVARSAAARSGSPARPGSPAGSGCLPDPAGDAAPLPADAGKPDAGTVLLVAMPWETLPKPSIQLGILKSVLDRAGIRNEVRSLKLAFMEHCLAATAGRHESERIRVADYQAISNEYAAVGLGDWIFAVPPFRDTSDLDDRYLVHIRSEGVPEAAIARALAMRGLVPAFLQRCVDEILAAAPRVVGFSSAYSQNVASLVLSKLLKLRDPSLRIVFGGSNCDGPMGAALHRAFPWIDVVVRGEAEHVLPRLARDLLAGDAVRPQPGLCYREGDRAVAVETVEGATVPMDDVPTPDFDEYFDRLRTSSFGAELLPHVRLLYETARGCWWGAKSHCTFCGLIGPSMTFRSKSPDRVVEEITVLTRRYRRLDFQMVDNILDLRYLRDLLPRLRDTGYHLRIFYETKANLKKDQVRSLRDGGVDRIQPGIESLSTPILGLMRKGVTAFQNVRLLKWCAQYGLGVSWIVIYGFPGEPPEEYARMADVVPSLTHLEPPMIARLRVERFSPYHQRPREFGLEVVGPLPHYRFVYPVDAATLTDLAYTFEYRHLDGRDPEIYAGPLCQAIEAWQAGGPTALGSLRYRRGPGFLTIADRRPNLETADYSFDEAEALIYLACEDGATVPEAHEAARAAGLPDLTIEDVHEFLDDLVKSRLAFAEGGRYLSLALPADSRETPSRASRIGDDIQPAGPVSRTEDRRGRRSHEEDEALHDQPHGEDQGSLRHLGSRGRGTRRGGPDQ